MAPLSRLAAWWRARWWRLLWQTQGPDYRWLLPQLSRLPLRLGFALAGLRDRLNGLLRRDWRSMSLGFPHIATQSRQAFQMMAPQATPATLAKWVRGRFETESRCDFEAYLVNQRRVAEMHCTLDQQDTARQLREGNGKGLLLLIPHFDSFHLGTAFLGQHMAGSNRPIHAMSSAVFEDPRVHPALQDYVNGKYRLIEPYLNGGTVMHLENGLRPFYRALEKGDMLVVLADSPPLPNGVEMEVQFLGARRVLAGGAVKMARRYDSQIAGFVCIQTGTGEYRLEFSRIIPVNDEGAVDEVYDFLSRQILAMPERWCAADLLTQMPLAPPSPGQPAA